MPEQSLQALEWFEALAEVDQEDRQRRLRELEFDEPDLVAAVRDLLAADEAEGLDSPLELAGALLDPSDSSDVDDGDEAAGVLGVQRGDRLGPFELAEILGEGGMGTVWEAHRVEGGFEQRVAIKFLRGLSADANAERRFAFEREVLGRLQHPAIARVLDAGRTEAGLPYLVMEHVDGVRIDEYCDQNRLSIHERIRLMIEICRAVAHAHRNLVVHRDLKPANILVTRDGVPRLLDFGIAKLLVDEEEAVALTAAGLVPMTLEYASPEQVQGLPVTTASDVYSLGVVLYQLFTGRTPFGRSAKSRLELGLSVARGEASSPSSALRPGSFETDQDAQIVVEARGAASVGQLRRELRGDLDNVVLEALQRDPERRYPGVDALAADLESWLRGFPVQARGDSLAYRTSKFLRRNWIVVSAACLVVLSLAVGLGVATWKANEARVQRDLADDHAQRTELVNQFLVNLLAAPGGRWWRDLEHKGPETRVIDVIDEAAARLEVELDAAPLQRAALHQTLNDTYLALGLPDRAEHQVRRALEIRRRELGELHPAVAESTYYFAATLKSLERYREALVVYRSALRIERRLATPSANYPHALSEAANTAARIGLHHEAAGLTQELADQASTVDPDLGGYLLARQAMTLAEGGAFESAESLLLEAARRFELSPKGGAPVRDFFWIAQGVVSWLAGDVETASVKNHRSANPSSRFWQAQVLYDLGRYEEASRWMDSADSGRMPPEYQVLMARLELAQGGEGEACRAQVQPLLHFEESSARGPTLYLAEARAALASCLLERRQAGDREQAEGLLASARETLDALFDDRTPLHSRIEAAVEDLGRLPPGPQ